MTVSRPASKSISIHALREEGDGPELGRTIDRLHISIHALREEGDFAARTEQPQRHISIHALREEGDTVVDDWRQFF